MAIQQTVSVKGASITNAYLKIIRSQVQAVKPTPKNPVSAGASTIWAGTVVLGVYADKAHADADINNALDSIVVQIPNVTTITQTTNVVAATYTYLLTLPQFAGATSV